MEDMVCRLVPFFMAWKHSYGFLQSTYRDNKCNYNEIYLLYFENVVNILMKYIDNICRIIYNEVKWRCIYGNQERKIC